MSGDILAPTQTVSPGTPAAGKLRLWSKTSDKRWYSTDDAGIESAVSSDNLPGAVRLRAGSLAGATTISTNIPIDTLDADLGWLVIDPFTTNCEVRKIGGVSGTTISVAALLKAHNQNTPVLWQNEPIVNLVECGGKGDNATNNDAAFTAAIAQLEAYTSGAGGGRLYIPPGIYLKNSTHTLPTGCELMGAGRRRSLVTGTVAGPLFQTASDGTGNALTAYVSIKDLFVRNLSTDSAARAIKLSQCANTRVERVVAYTAGGYHIEVVGGQTITFDGCTLAGGTGAEACLNLDGTTSAGFVNIVRLLNCDFQDAKSGVRAISGSALTVSGCHFEQLAGGATGFDASLFIDGWLGGQIMGSYWDTCSQSFIAFNNVQRSASSFVIGGNYFYNSSNNNPVIVSALTYSTILPNYFKSGALNVNSYGLYVDGTNTFNVIHPQFRAAGGTGRALNLQGTSVGNRVFKAGAATATWDPGSIANNGQASTTVALTGANLGDKVNVTFGISLGGLQLSAYVSTTDIVTVVLVNNTGAPVDLASGTLYVTLERL